MIEIVRAGFQITVEDAGRVGWRHLGVAPGGALDALALEVGNRLVGNPPDAAGLEVTFAATGPLVLRATRAMRIALSGADFGATLDGQPVWPWWSLPVRAGGELVLRAARLGMRGYVCVAGGIDVLPVLGSRSTDLLTGFGGLAGRALRTGDRLPVGTAAGAPVPVNEHVDERTSGCANGQAGGYANAPADAPAHADADVRVRTRTCLAPDAPEFGIKPPVWCRFSHAARLDARSRDHPGAYLDGHSGMRPGVYPDAHSAAHSSVRLDAHADANPAAHQSAHLNTHADVHPGTHQNVHLNAHSGAHSSIRLDIHADTNPAAHQSARPDTHAEAHPGTHQNVHPDAHSGAHSSARMDAHADANPAAHQDAHLNTHVEAHPGTHQGAHPDAHSGAHSSVRLDAHADANPAAHQGARLNTRAEVHPGTHQNVRPDAHSDAHSSVRLDVHSDVNPTAHQDAHLNTHAEVHPGTHQSAHLDAHSGAHSNVRLDTHADTYPAAHQGAHPDTTHPGIRQSAHLDAHLDTHPHPHASTHPAAARATSASNPPGHGGHAPHHATSHAQSAPQRPARHSPRRFTFADTFASEAIQRAPLQARPGFGKPPPAEWVRVLPGPEYDSFTPDARDAFWASEWRVTPRSNRMGYRLSGTALERERADELPSHAVLPGTIQVPPDGQPIVLMNDAQTTGGYPKIGVVIRADLWKLAQVRLNGGLRFVQATPDDARRALREVRAYLRQIDVAIALREGQYARQR